jgi:hypothetical protein
MFSSVKKIALIQYRRDFDIFPSIYIIFVKKNFLMGFAVIICHKGLLAFDLFMNPSLE